MVVVNDPLKLLIPILITLIILLILFRFNNWIDERKIKEKKPKEEPKKKLTSQVEKIAEVSVKVENKEETKKEKEIAFSNDNYLYDRFVVNPSNEDNFIENKTENSAFISEQELLDIRNNTPQIKVGDVQVSEKEKLYSKIEAMKNENLALKNQLLGEINSLSKEMKLMLLENLIRNMD